jgi:hypothetical protein
MTKPFNQRFHCPNCNTWQSQETMFSRWIRNNPQLDSRDGYSVSDQDFWVHKYKTDKRGRNFQMIMGVEIKTLGAQVSDPQSDTLYIVNQIMRNRRGTPTKPLMHQAGTAPLKAHSFLARREVQVRSFGIYVLRFSGLGPDDSEWIMWDNKYITEEQLTKLLRFDLDPDSFRPTDLRSHHPDPNAGFLSLPFDNDTFGTP